ncbi:MAG: type IV pilus biogenesis/stability protein PilW [Woeseiaceae bacterium]|nr:type IV pilus biogenesis/stability protein PilW [Woeseiaceae bacterium]
MNKSELITILAVSGLILGGCVSTTTGPAEPEMGDDAAEYNYVLGVRYLESENHSVARDRLERAVELDPRMGKAYMALGMAYEALENERLAKQAYESSVRVEPRNYELQNGYAVFLCRQRDYNNAEKYFERAAGHPENDTAETTLTNAGLCMRQKPDAAAAEAFFRQALEHKSNYGEALLQLCLLKFQQEDFLGSRAFLQRFMSSNRTTASVLFLAAEIESKLGNERGRTDYINQLLREFPQSPEARRALSSG